MSNDQEESGTHDEIMRRLDRWESIIIDNRSRIIVLEDAQKTMSTIIAEEAAEKAVNKMFRHIDIDINNAEDVRQFKANLNFVSIAHSTAKATIWSFFITVSGLIVSAVWLAVGEYIKK